MGKTKQFTRKPVIAGFAVMVLVVIVLAVTMSGCGIKASQLPVMTAPYVAEMDFFKEVKNVGGKAERERFKDNRITNPFYFYLKINDMENDGRVRVVFYKVRNKETAIIAEKHFRFGKPGKYYEYIIFFDRIDSAEAGKHRYAVFVNDRLLYDGPVVVREKPKAKTEKK